MKFRGILYLFFGLFNRLLRVERAISSGEVKLPDAADLRREAREILDRAAEIDGRAARAAVADPKLAEIDGFDGEQRA